MRARQMGVRVVLLRTAPVLASTGGMLARLLPSFQRGLGGSWAAANSGCHGYTLMTKSLSSTTF
jgi:NAD dependent epimerase/dehydratase family enzyme